jgi:hypothetical protein
MQDQRDDAGAAGERAASWGKLASKTGVQARPCFGGGGVRPQWEGIPTESALPELDLALQRYRSNA